jgi:YD repeat-containing protein
LNGDTGLASWLYGHGCLVTPNATSGHDFTYGHQVTTGSITAQTVFDAINGNFPPDLDDPFNVNGGTDSGLYLVGVNILRGIAHGIVYDRTGVPPTTMLTNVTLERASDSQNRGTDSTLDPQGRFYTSTPWHFGQTNHNVKYNSQSVAVIPSRTAKRDRAVFREPSTASYISTWVAESQRATYGVINDSGVAVLYHADGAYTDNWSPVDTPLTSCNAIAIAYDATSNKGRLHIIVGKTAGGIDGHYTDDEGKTTSVAVTVTAAGKNPSVAINPIGKRIVLYTNASALYRVVYDPQGNVITSASTIVASGVADAPTAIGWRLDKWYAFYRNSANALIQITSNDDGETWS